MPREKAMIGRDRNVGQMYAMAMQPAVAGLAKIGSDLNDGIVIVCNEGHEVIVEQAMEVRAKQKTISDVIRRRPVVGMDMRRIEDHAETLSGYGTLP